MSGGGKKKAEAPGKVFALRLTAEERDWLERRAGQMALGAYIRSVLFADGKRRTRRGSRRVAPDRAQLAQMLSLLGSSGLARDVTRLADAAETGVLHLDEHAPAALIKATEDIAVMRLLLMQALGMRVDTSSVSRSMRASFAIAARNGGRP